MRRKRPSRSRDDLSRKGIKHKKNRSVGSGVKAPGPFFVNKTFSVIFPGRWYNDCASAIRTENRSAPLCGDYTGNLRLVVKMPPAVALSPLRTWYNDCAKRNPARFHRADLLRRDYTGNPRLVEKMPPAASLSPLHT